MSEKRLRSWPESSTTSYAMSVEDGRLLFPLAPEPVGEVGEVHVGERRRQLPGQIERSTRSTARSDGDDGARGHAPRIGQAGSADAVR